MNIGIIGGGIAGLTAAYELGKLGHHTIVFEKNAEIGGQAATFKVGGEWLEKFYHHIFTSDTYMIQLINELGLGQKLVWLESSVGLCYQGKIYPFTTPTELLRFPVISLTNRLRLGLTSLRLQRYHNWHNLENITAREWIIQHAGKRNYEVVWEPLLRGKFGERSDEVGMVWFWGKIYVRLGSRGRGMRKEQLGYLMGSFRQVTDALAQRIQGAGGEIRTDSPVNRVIIEENQVKGIEMQHGGMPLDVVIATIPSFSFLPMIPELPDSYTARLKKAQYQATVCLVLTLKKSLSRFYWLNISDTSIPFVAAIEHTNFIDPARYSGKHIVYLSNYLSRDNPIYHKEANQLLEFYLPHLNKINPDFDPEWIEDCYLWREDGAQPIVGTSYSRQIPDSRTPVIGLYLANTTQIYPEDRGMNYSIRLGNQVSQLVADDLTVITRM